MARRDEISDEGGEGYFASISDLMVGILFIFLLMLTIFAINYADTDKDKLIEALKIKVEALEQQRSKLQSELLNLILELEHIRLGIDGERGRIDGLRLNLLQSLQSNLKDRGVQVEIEAAQGVLRLASDGLFLNNEPKFTTVGRESAAALLDEMKKLVPCYAVQISTLSTCVAHQPIFETILIEGHTDSNQTSRPGGNWALSTDRARAFLELMAEQQPELQTLRNQNSQQLLGLAGYGDSRTRPGISGNDERNRRIEIRFLLSGRQDAALEVSRRQFEQVLDRLKALSESAK